jgi:hypothetical protein
MKRVHAHRVRLGIALLSFSLVAAAKAAPVSRNEAFRAATAELPKFYAGIWNPAGELLLYNLSDEVTAFVFMFERAQKQSDKTPSPAPAAFVAKARADLATTGKAVSGYEPELRGADRYATIVISADDTEPPVLRCFLGLPPQIVREVNALTLAADKGGAGSWRVRHYLMLGFFDEAFTVESSTGSKETLIVDLRQRVVVTEKEAKTRALTKRAATMDPELIRMSQEAWAPYRATGKTLDVQPVQKESVSEGVTNKKAADPLPPPPRKGSAQ